MKEHAAELKRAGGKGAAKKAEEAQACLDKIAADADPDRVLAERDPRDRDPDGPRPGREDLVRHAGLRAVTARWSCFFRPAVKFKARYATLGFEDAAALDDGGMWPTSFAGHDT